jgi:hypothetical protein
VNDETKQAINDESDTVEERKEVRSRFRVERVVFIILIAVIAGLFFGSKTDLGIFGLMGMVVFMVASIYYAVNFFLGIGGGFSEDVPVDEDLPGFDWKRFAREPLVFLVVIVAGLILSGIYWVINRGN